MLEHLTFDTFAHRIGERFRIVVDDAATLQAELVEAELYEALRPTGRRRASFSLVFRIAGDDVLPQRIYRLEHDDLGRLDLFIVPVGRDDDGVRYEAVFS